MKSTIIRLRLVLLALVLAIVASLSVAVPAFAGGGYPDGDATDCSAQHGIYSWCKGGSDYSPRGYGYRNCTDWVAWRLESQGISTSLTRSRGNGKNWDDSSTGVSIVTTPEVGDAAVWNSGGSGFGHVAYVEEIRAKSGGGYEARVSEYNQAGDGNYNDTRWVTADDYVDFNGVGTSLSGATVAATTPSATSAVTKLVGDVDGDGKADAVVFIAGTGNWYTSGPSSSGQWLSGNGAGSAKQFLGDVNGDGKADAIYFFNSGSVAGNWYVALSTGSGFSAPYLWHSGFGSDSNNQLVGDVDGDGKVDATLYYSSGTWYAAGSLGTGGQWTTGHGSSSTNQFLADVNGDGKADAIVFFPSSGQWYVKNSTGSGFNGAYYLWVNGMGTGSNNQLVGDIDGDGKADALAYFGSTGAWYASPSLGAGGQWTDGMRYGADSQFVADVNGDGKADALAFFKNGGDWYVAQSYGTGFSSAYKWISGHGAES